MACLLLAISVISFLSCKKGKILVGLLILESCYFWNLTVYKLKHKIVIPKFTSSDTLLLSGKTRPSERVVNRKGRAIRCLGLTTDSLSLVDSVESLDPPVESPSGTDSTSLSNVTDEREDRSDGEVDWPLSLVLPVSQEVQ